MAAKEVEFTILLVEDDPNDVLLLERAIRKNGIKNPLQKARDGQEALEYLQGVGKFADRTVHPFPDLIILDLKMPRMSGLEFLAWVNEHPPLRVIPTIVMSSSQIDLDVKRAYSLGANSYIVKPNNFELLAKIVKQIHDYWSVNIRPRLNETQADDS